MESTVKVTTTFRLDKELLEIIRAKAKAANRSLNNYVECLLMEKVQEEPNELTKRAMRDAENNVGLEKVERASDLMKLLE
ncbi:MAG: ribbon-helix-helix protein, CopG family [Paludibacteraceae bacterium]|nr:ribbon-helix-helix protein, CopG family [Paludibacteraceae bacterium]